MQFSHPTRDNRGRMLDARPEGCVQGVGIRRTAYGTGVAPDRAPVCVEERAKALVLPVDQRLALRQRVSARLISKLHQYLLEPQPDVLPKTPAGAAVRYALNQWEALTRFLEEGELEIDTGATEPANPDIALGRGN